MVTPAITAPAQVNELLPHITALDGIRGTAILLVLLYHSFYWNTDSGSKVIDFIGKMTGSGWMGVDLFFALSGFLITGVLYESLGDGRYFRNFYGRRTLRIFPLYYLGIALLLIGFLLTGNGSAANLRPLGLTALFLQNTPLFIDHVGGTMVSGFTSHLWSLAVEEQFYLVWPLIVFLVRDRRRLMFLALGLALVAPLSRALLLHAGASLEHIYRFTFCRQDALLAGAWLALAVRGPERDRVLRAAHFTFPLAVAVALAVAIMTGNFFFGTNRGVALFGYSALAVAGASLIALVLPAGSPTARIFNVPFLRFLGKYSFGLYYWEEFLEHLPTLDPIRHMAFMTHPVYRAIPHLVVPALVLLQLVPIAYLSFNFYEKRFLKLKRFFNYAGRPPKVSTQPA